MAISPKLSAKDASQSQNPRGWLPLLKSQPLDLSTTPAGRPPTKFKSAQVGNPRSLEVLLHKTIPASSDSQMSRANITVSPADSTGRQVTVVADAECRTPLPDKLQLEPEGVVDYDNLAVVEEQTLTSGYGLTRKEAALAARIMQGRSPESAAEELGISPPEMATHFRRMRMKIGALAPVHIPSVWD
jgi:DNA-binding CsgD family transcriptional regulator